MLLRGNLLNKKFKDSCLYNMSNFEVANYEEKYRTTKHNFKLNFQF